MLGLLENAKGFSVPKNGRIKAGSLIDRIAERGIRLLARYLVEITDDIWIAKLVPPLPIPTPPRKHPISQDLTCLNQCFQRKN
ncbi:hypothetical protein D3C74_297430 [compost metagenome]